MLNFLQSQVLFYAAIVLVLFLPGYFLLLAIFGKSGKLSSLEKFILSFGLSIITVDFIFFIYHKADIIINKPASIAGIVIFLAICYAAYKLKNRKKTCNEKITAEDEEDLFNFSKNQFILILLLVFMAFFIKTAYLSKTVFPSATDMGHHMYWAKWMADTGRLPNYEGMPDFIIGEHVVFGIIGILSGASFFSAFPPVILYLANIFSLLTVFILVLRIFKNKEVAILLLLFLGVLFAVASPQIKFVSGGVVGNIFGNVLMPLALYFFYRAFSGIAEKPRDGALNEFNISKTFLSLAVFSTCGLFYTHHLTAFVFLFVFSFLVVFFLAVNFKKAKIIFLNIMRIVFSARVVGILFLCLIFFFWVFTPNYAQRSALDTAIGAPSKETRDGLSFYNIKGTAGEARVALGIFGLVLLAVNYRRENFGYAIIASWTIMLWLMSTKPNWLFINLPSSRIGNYLSYPLAILSAYGFHFVFKKNSHSPLIKAGFVIALVFVLISGISDSVLAFKNQNNTQNLAQTFNASTYAAKNTTSADVILKDHNYIDGDSWMKLFFNRGYKYPLSRGYFKRYEDATKSRENCTLIMISTPNSREASDCFLETGTNYIMVNPNYDGTQFKKLLNFNEVYASDEVVVFHKKY